MEFGLFILSVHQQNYISNNIEHVFFLIFSKGTLFKSFNSILGKLLPYQQNTMKILIVEPFYGGSHKQLIDFIMTLPSLEIELVQCVIISVKFFWPAFN